MQRLLLVLALCMMTLLVTACPGESTEVSQAKANYIEARARLLDAEARGKEAEVALTQQRLQQEQREATIREERSREDHQTLVEMGWVVVYVVLGLAVAVTILWTAGQIYSRYAECRCKLLIEERRLEQARACRLKQARLSALSLDLSLEEQLEIDSGNGHEGQEPTHSQEMLCQGFELDKAIN